MADEVHGFEYELAGRKMRFRMPHGGQLIMLQRMRQRAVRILEQSDDRDERIKTMSTLNMQTLDLIEALFLEPEDVAFVEQKMIEGVVDLPDLLPILSGGKVSVPREDDEDPVAPPASLKTKKPATVKAARKTAASRGKR